MSKHPQDNAIAAMAESLTVLAQARMAENYADGVAHGVKLSMQALLGLLEGDEAVGNCPHVLPDDVKQWARSALDAASNEAKLAKLRDAARVSAAR